MTSFGAWVRRFETRLDPRVSRVTETAASAPPHPRSAAADHPGSALRSLKLLSFNIQVGIGATAYRHYVTHGWKHLLPHTGARGNLDRIAGVVGDYDVVALQEIDSGSLRSRNVNQVRYLAEQAGFPFWYTQLNRDLGRLAQHGNGLLSRVAPATVEDHKLPGAIPGRGAILVRLPFGAGELTLVLLHLSLGERSRRRQLEYVRRLIEPEARVVVMGDMNSHLAGLLLSSPLARTRLRAAGGAEPTYPAWRPARALDHILVSPGLEVRGYEVLDCRLSDHRPIAVTLDCA